MNDPPSVAASNKNLPTAQVPTRAARGRYGIRYSECRLFQSQFRDEIDPSRWPLAEGSLSIRGKSRWQVPQQRVRRNRILPSKQPPRLSPEQFRIGLEHSQTGLSAR